MSKLVIAEKPMLARDIARAITGKEVSESARLPISGNGYTVCACAGHLLELVKPDAIDPKWGIPWSLDVLPIEVHDWPKEPASIRRPERARSPSSTRLRDSLKLAIPSSPPVTRTMRGSLSWTSFWITSATPVRSSAST